MENFYARSVFFVKDGEASLAFYTRTLGFALDWNNQYEGRASVFQVSLFGFELIINQVYDNQVYDNQVYDNQVYDNQIYDDTRHRAGHGRVFIGLEDHQAPALLQHLRERGIQATRTEWGRPTLVLRDADGNELFFWIPDSEWASLELPSLLS